MEGEGGVGVGDNVEEHDDERGEEAGAAAAEQQEDDERVEEDESGPEKADGQGAVAVWGPTLSGEIDDVGKGTLGRNTGSRSRGLFCALT